MDDELDRLEREIEGITRSNEAKMNAFIDQFKMAEAQNIATAIRGERQQCEINQLPFRTAEAVEVATKKLAEISDGLETERRERKAADEKAMAYNKKINRFSVGLSIAALVMAVLGFIFGSNGLF